MSVSYSFEGNALHISAKDTFTLDELKQSFLAALADPRFKKGMRLLLDGRDSRSNPTLNDLRARANLLKMLKDNFAQGYALVVTDIVYYELGRMFQVFAQTEGIEIQVFKDINDARQYLGINAGSQVEDGEW